MPLTHFLSVVGWLVAASSSGENFDYGKIERALKKEPAYETKSPKYALVVFGPEAKCRAWVVADGDRLFVDRNGDGDLTAADERFEKASDCKNLEILDPDGKTRYVITSIGFGEEKDPPRTGLSVYTDIKGAVEYQQYCDATMHDKPAKASIVHFHGPLAIGPRTINWKIPPTLALHVGEKPADLQTMVGTMSEEYGCWVVVVSHNGDKAAFPKGVTPEVKVEFPSKAPGGPPAIERYSLDEFC